MTVVVPIRSVPQPLQGPDHEERALH